MSNKAKISAIIFFAVIIAGLTYLTFFLNNRPDYRIDLIELNGNIHLSKEQYLAFGNLLDKNSYSNLTIQVIKDRIEKHPYVKSADVKYDGNNKILILIQEKEFESILLLNDQQYIVTSELQILPILPQTKKIDYPVISNPFLNENLKALGSAKMDKDVLTAAKIISSVKLMNPELYDGFSSIDMRNGGDILLNFSFLPYPVVVGRGSEIRKVVYFNSLWSYLKGKDINNYLEYVDLRYSGHIFLGVNDTTSEDGGNKS